MYAPRPVLISCLFLTSCLVLSGCGPTPAEETSMSQTTKKAAPPASDFLLGGIQVNEPDVDAWLDALAEEGMNTVSVTDYARQGDWDTDHLWWDEEAIPPAGEAYGIVAEVRAAKTRGFRAVLILRVALDHAYPRNRFLWHGMIMPQSDAELDRWFELYTEFAVRWAEVAEHEGVDVLMIGSEMSALTSTVPLTELPDLEEYYLNEAKQEERREDLLRHEEVIEDRHLWLREREHYTDLSTYVEARLVAEADWASQVSADRANPEAALAEINARRALLEEHWRRLVARLRTVYSGRLGYAANFDQYHMVNFWDALDLMGVNAYFPLRHRLLAPDEDLYATIKDGWSDVLTALATFRREQGLSGRNLVFTELGYTWRENSTIEPWADTGFSAVPTAAGEDAPKKLLIWQDQPEDLSERALALRALYEAHGELAEPMLAGLLYWKLSTIAGHQDIEAFMLKIGGPTDDPLAAELRAFLD